MNQKKSIVIPDCPCCKNFLGKQKDEKYCCVAFPDGIPYEYMWGATFVQELSECNNGYKYEEDETA